MPPEAAQDYAARRELLELFKQLSPENKHVVIGFCRGELRDQRRKEQEAKAKDFVRQLVASAERDRRRETAKHQ
jgi:hypothetical protein